MCHIEDSVEKIKSAFEICSSRCRLLWMESEFFSRKFLLSMLLFTMVPFLNIYQLSANPNPDYLGPKNTPRMVRDQYCGAYVVWHALRHYDRAMSIDAIIKDMRLEGSKGVSIADIVSTLKDYGLQARAVKLRLDNITSLKRPFIPYIPSSEKGSAFGHFVLCVPTGSSQMLILDGQEVPYISDLSFLKEKEYRAGWDGTSILLERSNSSGITLNGTTSQRLLCLSLAVILLGSFLWFFYKNRTGKQTMERRLPMDIN